MKYYGYTTLIMKKHNKVFNIVNTKTTALVIRRIYKDAQDIWQLHNIN